MRAGHVERESRASSLLSPYEHSTLVSLLGAKCQSLSTSVVQLFLTDGPDHSQWRRKDAGVLCFVKDHIRRSYFFRLYCLTRRSLVWEQQVYNNMKYMAPRTWLHTFEAEYAMAAFNFANDDEAESFQRVVLDQLEQKRIRRIERRSRASMGDTVQGSMPNLAGAVPPAGLINGPSGKHHRSASSGATGASKKKDKETLRRRIKKEEIGLPKDFRHVSHVGWDPNKGFDVDLDRIEDTNLKKFFEKAGVSESQLKDRDTREFIYEFIQRNGGLDAVKEDVVPPSRAPPVPSRVPPHKPSPPPPPPTLAQPSRACPPTPVSQQRSAPPPPPPQAAKPSMNQSSPAPPPPPPPPMADLAPPPPPLAPPMMPPAAAAPAVPDQRSALLAAIKSGTTLKHVEVEKKALPDSRGELLDQIRQGVELKTVQPNERPTGPSKPTEGLAAALAKALEQRNNAFRYSDSEPDSDSGDSEWEE